MAAAVGITAVHTTHARVYVEYVTTAVDTNLHLRISKPRNFAGLFIWPLYFRA